MSAGTGLGFGLAAFLLAVFLITGYIPSRGGALFITRKKDPMPYWLGIGFYVFALLVVLLIVAVRAAQGLPT
jgi:hypothetical protein